MATNASFIFYRSENFSEDERFGRNLDEKEIKEFLGSSSNTLSEIEICGIKYSDYFVIPDAMSFSLKTTYPGLIIGSGYNHPALEEGDFQLGFYFDHTTGMPVIPGATVKGILKSVFPKDGENEEIKSEKLKYVNRILNKGILLNGNNWEKLFGKEDIFFDACISEVPKDGKIFAEDYITPHTKGPFKNPTPLRFLKIAPDVTFTFQFKLKDSNFENNQKISSNEKLNLFKKILLDFGIGAKRNVGYGNFIEA